MIKSRFKYAFLSDMFSLCLDHLELAELALSQKQLSAVEYEFSFIRFLFRSVLDFLDSEDHKNV